MEVTIDGRKLTLEAPVTVLEAARLLGIDIPTLCWHPRVSVLGACRLCMIEVEGINRLLAACTTQVSDGMSVLTDTPQLRKVRETMLELLLCRHPLDCPTCVKGGECELQSLAYRYSSTQSRFPENPKPYAVSDPSPFVERDPKKCVLCRRCVRVCREVRGRTVLGAMERGYHKRVGTYFQKPLNSDFQDPYDCESCGSCINICPVGALNSKVRKFRARTWEGAKTDSVCPFCSVGCALTLQVKEGELVRSVPRQGGNNEDQACFKGRFGTDYVNAGSRLVAPLLRKDGALVAADPAEAAAFVAALIGEAKKVTALVSSSLTREEAAAAATFTKKLCPGGTATAVDTLGLAESGLCDSLSARDWKDLDGADLVVAAGHDFSLSHPVAGVRIRVARGRSGAGLLVLDPYDTLLGSEAGLWLRPAGAGLPLLLGAILHAVVSSHGSRLKAPADEPFLAVCPGKDAAAVEKTLGLAEKTVARAAAMIAGAGRPVFLGHRGWHDPEDQGALIMAELDRLLTGDGPGGIIFLGRDCNSRGVAALGLAGKADQGRPDLLLLFGADPAGTALPGLEAARLVRESGTVVVFDSFATASTRGAAAVLPLPAFTEKEGTFQSSSGLVQSVRPAVAAPPAVTALAETLGAIAAAMGKSFSAPVIRQGEERTGQRAAPPGRPPSFPAAGEWHLVLRSVRVGEHRLRLVRESEMLVTGRIVEVHPSDLASLDLEEGSAVEIASGGARLGATVRAKLKTPPGQVCLPLDMEDDDVAAFAAQSERPEGWPATFRSLAAIRKTAAAGGGER